MEQALELAKKAEEHDEVPVGALLTLDDKLIAQSFNQPISLCDPTAHAEMNVLRDAAQRLGNYRLLNTTLYVTLEPCAMCAGAIVHSRVKRVVFACQDPKTGAAGSVYSILGTHELNHYVEVTGGVLENSCADLIKNFFRKKR